MEQTRVIGVGAYSRQTKILDQTRKSTLSRDSTTPTFSVAIDTGRYMVGWACLGPPLRARRVPANSISLVRVPPPRASGQ